MGVFINCKQVTPYQETIVLMQRCRICLNHLICRNLKCSQPSYQCNRCNENQDDGKHSSSMHCWYLSRNLQVTGWFKSPDHILFLNKSARFLPIKLKHDSYVHSLLRIFLNYFWKSLVIVSLRYGSSKSVDGFEAIITCTHNRIWYCAEWKIRKWIVMLRMLLCDIKKINTVQSSINMNTSCKQNACRFELHAILYFKTTHWLGWDIFQWHYDKIFQNKIKKILKRLRTKLPCFSFNRYKSGEIIQKIHVIESFESPCGRPKKHNACKYERCIKLFAFYLCDLHCKSRLNSSSNVFVIWAQQPHRLILMTFDRSIVCEYGTPILKSRAVWFSCVHLKLIETNFRRCAQLHCSKSSVKLFFEFVKHICNKAHQGTKIEITLLLNWHNGTGKVLIYTVHQGKWWKRLIKRWLDLIFILRLKNAKMNE